MLICFVFKVFASYSVILYVLRVIYWIMGSNIIKDWERDRGKGRVEIQTGKECEPLSHQIELRF